MSSAGDAVVVGSLDGDGRRVEARILPLSALRACPQFIISPEHYDADGRCRCTDERHTRMIEWGYRWSDTSGRWEPTQSPNYEREAST